MKLVHQIMAHKHNIKAQVHYTITGDKQEKSEQEIIDHLNKKGGTSHVVICK